MVTIRKEQRGDEEQIHPGGDSSSRYENVPDEAFMILGLDGGALQDASGVAKYRAEFDAAV